jgi:enoyl-CoA hydratase
MLTGRDIDATEAKAIGLASHSTSDAELLTTCYGVAERIAAFSRPGIELTKRMLAASLDGGSLSAHMRNEGLSQLYVRLTTRNFEEAITARKEKRPPDFKD